jgi:uncharacterized membrane protein
VRILIHPLIVHFPVALWLTSAFCDILYLSRGDRFYLRASRYLIGIGLVGAAASIASGFFDYIPLVAEGIGEAFVLQHRGHSVFAAAATVVYGASYWVRRREEVPARGVLVILLVLGAALVAWAGWLGGELRRVM